MIYDSAISCDLCDTAQLIPPGEFKDIPTTTINMLNQFIFTCQDCQRKIATRKIRELITGGNE